MKAFELINACERTLEDTATLRAANSPDWVMEALGLSADFNAQSVAQRNNETADREAIAHAAAVLAVLTN